VALFVSERSYVGSSNVYLNVGQAKGRVCGLFFHGICLKLIE
jgi:hypothetical protein